MQKKTRTAPESFNDLLALHPSLYSAPFDKGSSFGSVVDTRDYDECCVPLIYVEIDSAIVTLPYSANFERILPELKRVIGVFERHGYTAYDRQIDAILTSSSNFLQSGSSFATTRDEPVQQMLSRGETVIGGTGGLIGKPTEKKHPWKVIGVVIFLIAAIGVVVVRQQRMSELPPNVRKELQDLPQRMKSLGTWDRESPPQPERR